MKDGRNRGLSKLDLFVNKRRFSVLRFCFIVFLLLVSWKAEAAPIELWCPWPAGQRWMVGGMGSYYGEGYHRGIHHFCIDMNWVDGDDMGQNILAAANGVVSENRFNNGYGWMIRINHDQNTQTLYAHLIEQSGLAVGHRVSHGDVIGRCDNTPGLPYSTGSHLHFCLYQNGVTILPEPLEGHSLFDGIVLTSGNVGRPRYTCKYYRQSPYEIGLYRGDEEVFVVAFENTGSRAWKRNSDSPNYIELRSVNFRGEKASSFLCHNSWIGNSCKRVVTQTADNVVPGEKAWFEFKVKVPGNAQVGRKYEIYFRPWHKSGGFLDDWGGMHFVVRIKQRDEDDREEEEEEEEEERRRGECNPGQTERRGCRMCGRQVRRCGENEQWSGWSDCTGQGACDPDQFQIRGCNNCGRQRRDCNDNCQWQAWEACQEQGICNPGQTEEVEFSFNIGQCHVCRATKTCMENCLWGSLTECRAVGAEPERCDLRDNDCNGVIDNGAHCRQPVYRFYRNVNGDVNHAYRNEGGGMNGYQSEGLKFRTYRERVDGRLTRLWKLRRRSPRDTFLTSDRGERDRAIRDHGYEDRGDIGFCAREEVRGFVRLYRLWNRGVFNHFYTVDRGERDNASANLGYVREGVECWVWAP